MSNKKVVKHLFSIVLLGIILVSIFILSYLQPIYADDYNYAFIFGTSERISSFSDIFKSLGIFYNSWGGRVIPMFLSHLFLWWGRGIFAICNTIVYFIFCFLIYKCTLGINDEENDWFKIWIVHMLVLFGAPIVSETILWEVGSFNYLWLMMLSMLYIYPYLLDFFGKKKLNDNLKTYIVITILGFLAGMGNENVVPIIIGANLVYIIYSKIVEKRIKIWSIVGGISASIGAAVLMLSPGNIIRSEVEYNEYNIPRDMSVKFKENYLPVLKIVLQRHYLIICLLFFALLAIYIYKYGCKNKELVISLLLVLSAIISNLMMIYPSTYSVRSSFGGGIFIILGTCILGSKLYYLISEHNILFWSITLIGFLLIFGTIIPSIKNGVYYNKEYSSMINFVESEKSKGNLNIEVKAINYKKNRFFSGFDFSNNKDYVHNKYFSKYYGIDSIIAN